ncbi:MAG TPA: DUF3971 domain-containing protein [Stellaceae bacterium]|nr:DUF3971 domain-containing protein [Stellaceae bacterium]
MSGAADNRPPQPARVPQHGQGRRPPHVRLARAIAVVVVVLVAIIAAMGGVAIWRLSRGPVVLDPVTPYLASALSSGPNGVLVTIDHTVLSWSNRRIHLFAQGVHLNQPVSGSHLTFRGMEIVLSPWALLQGRLAPSRVVLDRPVLRLVRAVDGSFRIAVGEQTAESDTAEFWGTRLTRDIAAPLGTGGPLQYLSKFEMSNATLIVDDKSLGVTWRADQADVVMERNATGVDGNMQLAVGIGGKRALLNARLAYRNTGELSVRIDFDGVDPALFASAAPALQPLGVVDLPVSGEMALGFDTKSFAIDVAFCDVRFGAGTLREADLPDGTAPVSGGALKASYNPTAGRVDIENLSLDLGGSKVVVEGEVDNLGSGLLAGGWPNAFDVSARLTAAAIPIDSLPHLWPEKVGPHTRHWITTRVHDGVIDSMNAVMALHVDVDAPKPVNVTRFDGTGSYRNLTIEYFPPLEPVRGVNGTVAFDRTHMDFAPISGHVFGGREVAASVKLYNLDTNDEMGDIDVTLSGPLRDALKVLDTKPLQYAKALGLDAEHASGDFTARIFFRLPLKHDLNFDEVEYRTEAQLSAVAVPHAFFNRDLSDGAFKMTLDRTALTLDGTAAIDGAPVKLTWLENLGKQVLRRRYTVQGRLDDAARTRLGFDFSDYATMHGPIDVALTYGLRADRRAEASVTADLKDATAEIPKVGWRKAAGQPAMAKFTLQLAGDQLTQVRNATLVGSGINARLSADFDKTGLSRVDIPLLVAGETNAQVTLARTGNSWTADLSGPSYDASGLLRDVSRPAAANPPPVAIHAKVGRLVLGPNRQLTDFSARLQSNGPHWTEAAIDGALAEGKKLTVRFGGANGPSKFDLTADDFGALLRALDVTGDIEGGTFAVKGDAVDQNGKRVLKGTFNGADYRLVHAPLFARLLTLTSFSGVSNLLAGGSGIPFKVLQGDMVYSAGGIKIDNMRAYGGAIGISANGTVDYDAGTLDASGTLVPANILNTVIGDIPVIGSLLVGGEGQGIFGANFRVAGPISNPQIAVNPLSAIAPGFLRNLFLFKAWNPAPNAPPKPDSSTPAGNP